MPGGKAEESALSSARQRFLDSLPQKARELGSYVTELEMGALPHEASAEIHRRLHALYASALVFRMPALTEQLESSIALIDRMSVSPGVVPGREISELERGVNELVRLAHLEGSGDRPSPLPESATTPDDRARTDSRARTHAEPRGAITLPFVAPVAAPEARPPLHDFPLLTRSLRVLVLARSTRSPLCAPLEAAGLSYELVGDAETLLSNAREEAPDVVLAEADLAHDVHLAAQLRGDPSTDYLPIVLVREAKQSALSLDALRSHVDAVVSLPLDPSDLARVLGRVCGALIDEGDPLAQGAPAALSLDELAARVAESVRRGILEAAEGAHGASIKAGDDAAVRAAALATVASVRAFVEEHTEGRVRFDERAAGGHPGLLQLRGAARDDVDLNGITGRRVLIADDDTGIVVLLAGLFRKHGAIVVEVTGGDEALASARHERPDLVITDIVMPDRDGIALCRALADDPLLSDVPVLLIPAKEELLICIRDGHAGALRRDQIGRRVLAQAASALAPRLALEDELRAGGEVRGALDAIGVVALLRSVRRLRPEARVVLRDAWNTFEVLLQDGRIARLTRTASDGSFVRGEGALAQLVGIARGRFSVESTPVNERSALGGTPSGMLAGTLDEALLRASEELSAQLEAVRLPALARVSRVTFDEDALSGLLRHGSAVLPRVVESLQAGARVADLPRTIGVALPVLEALLVDLTRRGALRAVDADGSDLVEEVRTARRSRPPSAHASPLSRIPPPPAPVISLLPPPPSGELDDVKVPPPPALPDPSTLEAANEGAPGAALGSVLPHDEPRSGRRFAGFAMALVALAALGFVAGRARDRQDAMTRSAHAEPGALGDVPEPSATAVVPSVAPVPAPAVESPFVSADEAGFRVVRGVPQGLKVTPQQGALVVEALPGLERALLRIDDRPLGPLPRTEALADGVHELALEHGDAVSYRFVSVRPGHTYTLTAL